MWEMPSLYQEENNVLITRARELRPREICTNLVKILVPLPLQEVTVTIVTVPPHIFITFLPQ